MDATNAVARLTDQPVLDPVAEPLSRAVRGAYGLAGPVGHSAKNFMHGVWLRHPLAGAAAAAVTGLTDWSDTQGASRRTGLIHGLLNITATTLYASAFILRKRGARSAGQSCVLAGYAIAAGAAWLGGDLVYDQRVGVTHAVIDEPESFTVVAKSDDIPDGAMRRVRRGDLDLLIVRQHGRLCALVHSCSHLGGPLSEGTLKDGSVVCPWHGSEFALEDGKVLNGPATQNQPYLDVRERGGRIEVKRHPAGCAGGRDREAVPR